MRFLNYTAHTVTVYARGADPERDLPVAAFPSVGEARCDKISSGMWSTVSTTDDFSAVEIDMEPSVTFGAVYGLPEPQEGVFLIVSALVKTHPSVAHRSDLVSPGKSVVREKMVVGCEGLCWSERAERLQRAIRESEQLDRDWDQT